jgi:hypothetical protein
VHGVEERADGHLPFARRGGAVVHEQRLGLRGGHPSDRRRCDVPEHPQHAGVPGASLQPAEHGRARLLAEQPLPALRRLGQGLLVVRTLVIPANLVAHAGKTFS